VYSFPGFGQLFFQKVAKLSFFSPECFPASSKNIFFKLARSFSFDLSDLDLRVVLELEKARITCFQYDVQISWIDESFQSSKKKKLFHCFLRSLLSILRQLNQASGTYLIANYER